MSSNAPIILADAITTAVPTAGPAVGLRGERITTGTATNRQRYSMPIEVNCQASGAVGSTATVLIRVSADASSWTTWATLGFVIPASGTSVALNRVGALNSSYDYIDAYVTAISGATINAVVRRLG